MFHAFPAPRCFTQLARLNMVRVLIALAALAGLAAALPSTASAVNLQPGFESSAAFSGLTQPIAVQFSQDGRVFVAEKSGLIKVFDGLGDTTPTTFADLRTQVHNYWDRGVEGLALHPNFPAVPYVYVYYVHDAPIGGTAPTFGQPNVTSDDCPNPPGGTVDGCVVSGRISRLTAAGNQMTGPEHVLVEDWCQQYPSHAGGGMGFGADGYLYFTGGEGAAWHFSDYGQDGDPLNPCGDPPGGAGATQAPPYAQGGRLRAQDLRTPGDPVGLSGSLIRIDPITGDAAPGNPLAGNSDPNARRILAYGLRNPFRLAMRPGTNEAFIADVGGGYWEEINKVNGGTDPVRNFGWPCYEGGTHGYDGSVYAKKLPSWDALNLDICENLYADGTAAAPYWSYEHDVPLTPQDNCDPGGNSISGIEFYPQTGGVFPASFGGALFFADYSRECMWVMKKGANGLPDPHNIEMFANLGIYPVDLKVGPGGDLFFVDIAFGQIRRITYTGDDNRAPTARAEAAPSYGEAPLEVGFDASASTDPDAGDTLTYEWDLDGDGEFETTEEHPRVTYPAGSHEVTLRVTDSHGAHHSDTITINSGETPPQVSIDSPSESHKWHVGETINFAGSATDDQDGALPASALSWKLILNHCVTVDACHSHPIQDFDGVSSGYFTGPDHGYPSHLVLQVTATDSKGLKDTKSIRLDPQTANLIVRSAPAGLNVSVDEKSGPGPLIHEAIVGATTTIAAETPQTAGSTYYGFGSWSDGKAQSHEVTVPSTDSTYTATFDQLTKLTFLPAADARIEEANPNTNYGTATKLRMDMVTGANVESYLRFNVTGVTGNVESARLRLSATTETVDGPALRSAGTSWTETGLNWSNKPSVGSTIIDDRAAIPANTYIEYNVKPLVTGDGPVAFALLPTSSDGIDFASKEFADAARKPVLEMLVQSADHTAPTAPADVAAQAIDARRVDLSWTPATDNRGVTNYEIYRDGSLLATTGNVTSFSDTTVQPQTTYAYTVKALDAAGNRSPVSNSASATTPQAPLTTLTFTPVADTRVEDGSPNANFGSSVKLQSGGGVPRRESYLRFQLAGITGSVVAANLKMTSTTDGSKDGPALYGSGGGWNETELAWTNRPSHSAQAADDIAAIPKGTIANYNAKSLVNGNGLVNMALISTYNDNVDFGSREAPDTAVRPQLTVTFDASTNDAVPPSAPGTVTADAPGAHQVNLSWGAATDNIGVTGYEISRDGSPIATVGAVTSYADSTVGPLTHYDYVVKALDAAGNRSGASNTAGVDTPAPPSTTTANFYVTADARLEEGAPDTNFGTATKLRATNSVPKFETYFKFNLAGITGNVQSAKLHVWDWNDATNNGPAVYQAGNSWTESGITWTNRTARIAGPSDNKVAIPVETWVEYDVTPLVAGNGEVSLVLVGDSTDGANFASKEYNDPSKRAMLEVTYGG